LPRRLPRSTLFPYTTLFRSIATFEATGSRGHSRHPCPCSCSTSGPRNHASPHLPIPPGPVRPTIPQQPPRLHHGLPGRPAPGVHVDRPRPVERQHDVGRHRPTWASRTGRPLSSPPGGHSDLIGASVVGPAGATTEKSGIG